MFNIDFWLTKFFEILKNSSIGKNAVPDLSKPWPTNLKYKHITHLRPLLEHITTHAFLVPYENRANPYNEQILLFDLRDTTNQTQF